jgi:hypothetical protein
MFSMESHRQVVMRSGTNAQFGIEIRLFENKTAIPIFPSFAESESRIRRVNNGQGKLPAVLQDSGDFFEGAGHVVNVVERHERNSAVGTGVRQRQLRRIANDNLGRFRLACGSLAHGERAIDSEHGVTARTEIAGNPALATADV